MKTPLLILLIIFCTTSCKLDSDVDITLPTQKKYHIVEAILKTDKDMSLLLTQSNRMNDIVMLNFVWYAQASFIINNDTIPLTNYLIFDKENNTVINYLSKTPLPKFTYGDIKLLIIKDKDTITSTSHFIKPISIKSWTVNGVDINVTIPNIYDSADRFFRIETFTYHSKEKITSRYAQLYNLAKNNEELLNIHMKVGKIKRDSIKIIISHITKEHYEYLYSCNRAIDAYFDPFTVPTPIKTNVKGAIGIFTVVDEKYISLKSTYP